jgi:TolB-like protein/tetratricopeptide (TPR) repeat protein/predicted Ser/Thr protein kinase
MPALAAGERLGPYEIVAPIGAGGMGEVYKATDTRLGRTVAIKTMHPAFLERFQQEARAIAALNHPHICTLHDVGPDYLVMEYVQGEPVRGPLPTEQALHTAVEIADALEAAHQAGVIHRDLKPANILITRSGVKLMDFGLAKVIPAERDDGSVTASQDGMVFGTVAYMSPERLEGKSTDARSDIFSFGLVLYEMLSGSKAFAGPTSASTIGAILHKEPPPLSAPPHLERIVMRAIRKAPEERFQSMAEVRAALEGAKAAGVVVQSHSIAVLPFANIGGSPGDEYFGDGLAEEIQHALTQLAGLRVAPRTSAFAFKGRNEDVRRIGEALSITHVLEGTVRHSGSRVRVTAQLISANDGSNLWSERYERELTDIFAIQDEIAQAIVGVLKVKLGGKDRPLVRRQTSSLAAYQAYLEGRYQFEQYTPASLARSCQSLERAIQLDPGYAAPHAGLAESYLYLTNYEPTPMREVIPKALAAAGRAIELDPAAAEGYMARGLIRGACQYQWKAAGADFDQALQFNPDHPLAHYRRSVWYLLPLGRMEEAVTEAQRAAELDPLSPLERVVEALMLSYAGHDERAIERCRTVLDMFPASFTTCFAGALVLGAAEMLDEAEATVEQGLQSAPGNTWLLAVQAAIYARQGKDEQVVWIRSRLETLSRQQYVPAVSLGLVQAAIGSLEDAFRLLEKAIDEHQIWTVFLLRSRLFTRFLSGPRHSALFRKMNLE